MHMYMHLIRTHTHSQALIPVLSSTDVYFLLILLTWVEEGRALRQDEKEVRMRQGPKKSKKIRPEKIAELFVVFCEKKKGKRDMSVNVF